MKALINILIKHLMNILIKHLRIYPLITVIKTKKVEEEKNEFISKEIVKKAMLVYGMIISVKLQRILQISLQISPIWWVFELEFVIDKCMHNWKPIWLNIYGVNLDVMKTTIELRCFFLNYSAFFTNLCFYVFFLILCFKCYL